MSDSEDGLVPNKVFRFKKASNLFDNYAEDELLVNKVIFYTFSTKESTHTIHFSQKVSLIYAIRKVEDWLSEDVCENYYHEMMQKLSMEIKPWIEVVDIFEIRGDFLGKEYYIQKPEVDDEGVLILRALDVSNFDTF